MIDLTKIVSFEWDAGNARKSHDKHGVSQAEAEQVFFNEPLIVTNDVLHSNVEKRVHALGKTDANRLLQIAFILKDDETRIRVISARPMSRKERALYAKEA